MHFKHLVCAHLVIAAAALAACQGPDADQVRETEQAWVGVVDEGDGCTLTQGYWKNHEESWSVSSLTIGGVDYSAEELLDLLRTPTKGDASLILGHQLIAALLNVASGAGTPQDVADARAAADAWMAAAANQDADGRLPYTVKSGPTATTRNVLHWPAATGAFLPYVRPSPLTGRSVRFPRSTLYATTLFSSALARTM